MGAIASLITSLTIVYSTVYSDANQRKHQSSASLAFVWGTHRVPVNSPHKWPVTRNMFPFDDVIMWWETIAEAGEVSRTFENEGTYTHKTHWAETKWPPFADDIFKCICLNENAAILVKISPKLVPKGPIYNKQAFVRIMAWPWPGDKPLSEPILLTHVCIILPQWFKSWNHMMIISSTQ